MKTSKLNSQQFQELILNWFAKQGRKNLPWQQNKTPYRIWVSEIMLQQTQVRTVIPYFERFMKTFPDLKTLAYAEEDDILHLWAGLGYYSRARYLHRAAKTLMEKYAGVFPNTLLELRSLPGIGQSTAGAILAIAFNQPAPILDGNVKRVLARFHAITEPINEKSVENQLWRYATDYTPTKHVADYTQAMMDLGATLCTRSKLQCQCCPLVEHCSGHQQGIAELLPVKKKARELPTKEATFIIIKKDKQILLYKRPSIGIWGGLWSLPEIPGKANTTDIRRFCAKNFNIDITNYTTLENFRHTFSHYHLNIFPVMVQINFFPKQLKEGKKEIWYNLNCPQKIGFPKPIQSILSSI